MRTLQQLHARLRMWWTRVPRRSAQRPVRLELEALERRDAPAAGLYPVVSASYGGTSAYFGLTANGQVEVSTNSGASWTPVTGASTVATSLVATGGNAYMLASNGSLYQSVFCYSGSGTNWTAVTGDKLRATTLVSALGGMYLLGWRKGDTYQTVWQYGGKGDWEPVTGSNTNATALVSQKQGGLRPLGIPQLGVPISDDSGNLVMLASNGPANQTVWQYTGSGKVWTPLTGSNTNATALAAVNTSLYMLGSNGPANQTVWQYTGTGTTWTPVTGSNTQALQLIAGQGNLYMVGGNGGTPLVWQYTGTGTNWTALTGAALQNGLATWGLALEHPVADTAYSPVSGTLFNPSTGTPSYLDVDQGQLGDCWMLASLAEVAVRRPGVISNMFVYDGTTVENGTTVGVYSVRLYTSTGGAQYVTVDTELPSGGGYYDYPLNSVLWVTLAEKAYAEANGAGYVTSGKRYDNAYDALEGGNASWALQAITGTPANDYNLNSSEVVNAWNAGQLVVLSTKNNPDNSNIVDSHCYALVNYNASARGPAVSVNGDIVGNYSAQPANLPFEIFNPWGTNAAGWALGTNHTKFGLFYANAKLLSRNFDTESFGGAAAGAGLGTDNSIIPNLGLFGSTGGIPVSGSTAGNGQVLGSGSASVFAATTPVDHTTIPSNEANGDGAGRSGSTSNDTMSSPSLNWSLGTRNQAVGEVLAGLFRGKPAGSGIAGL